MSKWNKEKQQALTPQDALKILVEGNTRFTNNSSLNRNLLAEVQETASAQYPFAAILSCIDSRASAEIIFDLGVGDIFSIRIAGNILNEDILGSLEFATEIVGTKLAVVLGHTSCGAIQGACNHAELGHLTGLLKKIEPAIDAQKKLNPNANADDVSFINQVSEQNVRLTMKAIIAKSPIIKDLIEEKKIALVGAMYDIASGKVHFLD